ncbi:MAG: hypothetical protein KGY81_06345, partial [Phycisphaerae bacterium]|nr:hypothetical protein [Phycisphaerae bacterium]
GDLTWSMCRGFEDVLFTTEGVRFFPVSAGVTELSSREELRENDLLANARARGGRRGVASSLLEMVFNANGSNEVGMVAVGEDVPAMMTWTPDRSGWVLWRLLETTEPVVAESITDDIRKALVRDWKLKKAFGLAKAKAAEITTAEQLDAWAKQHDVEPIETRMLARKQRPVGQRAGGYVPSRLASLGFSETAVDVYVLGQAFTALAPTDPDGDYPQVSTDIASVPLPAEGEVLLIQRIDYRPAMADGYDLMQKSLMDQLEFSAGLTTLRQWFNPIDIRTRVDYREKQQ